MVTELSIRAVHQEGRHFIASSKAGHTVSMDYPRLPEDSDCGFKPMELLLASLAGCGGIVLIGLLRRMSQPVNGMEIAVHGQRRDEHPQVFTHISLEFVVHGDGVDAAAVDRALSMAEEQLCPVWAMVKGATTITTSVRLDQEEPGA